MNVEGKGGREFVNCFILFRRARCWKTANAAA